MEPNIILIFFTPAIFEFCTFTKRLDRVFVDARAQNWKNVAANVCLLRGILVHSHVPQHTTLEIREICLNLGKALLNLGINKDLELVLRHFWGLKNVRHLPCGFEFSRSIFRSPPCASKQIELSFEQ